MQKLCTTNLFSTWKVNINDKNSNRNKSISYRTKLLREKVGSSPQFEFFGQNPEFTAQHRKDPWVDIAIGWNRKQNLKPKIV